MLLSKEQSLNRIYLSLSYITKPNSFRCKQRFRCNPELLSIQYIVEVYITCGENPLLLSLPHHMIPITQGLFGTIKNCTCRDCTCCNTNLYVDKTQEYSVNICDSLFR